MDGINVNSREIDYALMIVTGLKTIETRHTNSLASHIGQRVYVIRTGVGRPMAIGEVTIGEPKIYHNTMEFVKDAPKHLILHHSQYFIKPGGVKYGYPLVNPVMYRNPQAVASGGIVIRKDVQILRENLLEVF